MRWATFSAGDLLDRRLTHFTVRRLLFRRHDGCKRIIAVFDSISGASAACARPQAG
jgi:hypothetical protein